MVEIAIPSSFSGDQVVHQRNFRENQMKANKLKIGLCIWFLLFTTLANSGDDSKCSDAMNLGEKAYDRTELAYNAGAKSSAIKYSKAFWDIYDSNRNCKYLEYLASRLEGIGIKHAPKNMTEVPSSGGGGGGGGGGCGIARWKTGSMSRMSFITYMEECDSP